MKYLFLILLLPLCVLAQTVTVTIEPDQIISTSRFSIGTTHTHGYWEYGNAQAVDRAADLLSQGITYQNQHIMGWGAGNPEPEPDVFDWSHLDHRVELMQQMDTPMMITFCQAPGWMKDADDWDMDQEVLDEYVDDFAELCWMIAERYPDVQFFQIWNELKGYWSSALNNWDYERYTAMYNNVYEAVKAVRPDAWVGGPYIVIQGDGAGQIGRNGNDTFVPLGGRDRTFLNYWLENKVGADFICMDYGLVDYHDNNSYSHDELMLLTQFWGSWLRDVRELTDLPIVISEFYGGSDAENSDFTAANHASCYRQALLNDASIALQWNPEAGELDNFLFTDTEKSDGGQPTPHYFVVQHFNDFFGPGTPIVQSTSSSEWLEVLACAEKVMLINKKDEAVSVDVDGTVIDLAPYQVKVIDTPATSAVADRAEIESSLQVLNAGDSLQLKLLPAQSGQITMDLYNVLGQRVLSQQYSAQSGVPLFVQPFREITPATGLYFVRVSGLEMPVVKKIYFQPTR